jgi:hypothetical protein
MPIEHLIYLVEQQQFNRLQEVLVHFQFVQEPPDSFWQLLSKHLLGVQDQFIVKIMNLYLVFNKPNSPLQAHFLQLFHQMQVIEQAKQECLTLWFQFLTEQALQKIPMENWTIAILLQLCTLLRDSTSQFVGVQFFEQCLAIEKQWLQKHIKKPEFISEWNSLLFEHYCEKQVKHICALLLSEFNDSSEHLIKSFFVTFQKMVSNIIETINMNRLFQKPKTCCTMWLLLLFPVGTLHLQM